MEVGVSMFNKKGSTLIEALFAFEIFVSVLMMFVSLFISIYQQEAKLKSFYQKIEQQEVEVSLQNDYISLIQEVLH